MAKKTQKAKSSEEHKVKCFACDWTCLRAEVLIAENPFIKNQLLTACPRCREINVIIDVCDEPRCWEIKKYFTATKDGGRRTCEKHRPTYSDDHMGGVKTVPWCIKFS